jgi:hypothetical protein
MMSHTVALPSGLLRVHGVAGTEVWVEGEHVGALPLTEVTVPIGTREVVFRHPQYGERRQMVEVGAAGTADVTVWFGADAAAAAAATLDSPAPPPLPPVATPGAAPRLAPLSAPRAPRSDSIR